MIDIYSINAGFCSEANERLIATGQKDYILGLKGNKPELLREAKRVLGAQSHSELSSQGEKYPRQPDTLALVSDDSDGSLSGLERP